MFEPFKTCFTFLQRKTKFLNQPKTIDTMSGFHNKRLTSINKFSSKSLTSSSFLDMGISNQFKHVFNLIDTNDDGKISTSEFIELLSCLGYKKHIATKEAQVMVSVLDSNGDGFVDLDEFMVVVNDIEHKFIDNKEQDNENLMDAFLVFDIDKNGLISDTELKRVLVSLGFDQCSLRECKQMIKGVDKNGDGFVDFEEFRSMMKLGLVAN